VIFCVISIVVAIHAGTACHIRVSLSVILPSFGGKGVFGPFYALRAILGLIDPSRRIMQALSRSDAADPIIERRVAAVKWPVILAGREVCGCLITEYAGCLVMGKKQMRGMIGRDDLANGLEENGRVQNKEIWIFAAWAREDGGKAEHIQDVPEHGDIS
jgi:hypothetical protein